MYSVLSVCRPVYLSISNECLAYFRSASFPCEMQSYTQIMCDRIAFWPSLWLSSTSPPTSSARSTTLYGNLPGTANWSHRIKDLFDEFNQRSSELCHPQPHLEHATSALVCGGQRAVRSHVSPCISIYSIRRYHAQKRTPLRFLATLDIVSCARVSDAPLVRPHGRRFVGA